MKIIFVVDDSDTNLSMAEAALENRYNVMTMPSAAGMFALLEKVKPDIILLDIEMPEMDGFEALQKLKSEHRWADIPVMFLTGRTDDAVEVRGFQMGAVDFVTKPFSAPVLINRVKTHLDISTLIKQRTEQISRLQDGIISVLADMVEGRDKGTDGHIERTSIYIRLLIEGMKAREIYLDEVNQWDVDWMISSARMHDLGKISITDVIVNKPDKLTEEEYELMKTHVHEGERIIDEIISKTGEDKYLSNAKLIAGCHHERWDGSGYPRGLKGEEIPLQGRVMAIVDVYDALVSERSYKKTLTHEQAIETIVADSGAKYDPKLIQVLKDVEGMFKTVRMGLL